MNKLLRFSAEAKKFLVALVAALGVLSTALSDGMVTTSEWIGVSVAFLGALCVYGVTNAEK